MKQVRINIGQDNSVTTKYNYGQYQSRVEAFLSRIYRDSKDWFEKPSNLDSLANLVRLVGFLDLYLHYYYEVHRDKFDYVFEAISGKCRGDIYEVIGIRGDYELNYEYDDVKKKKIRTKGLYGDAHASGGSFIDMNTTLSDETLLLYFAHELGHVVNRHSLEKLRSFSYEIQYNINTRGLVDRGDLVKKRDFVDFVNDGLAMLDETTTQDRAEDVKAYYTGRMRRKVSEFSQPFYDGKTYKTNFGYYGEFEEPTVLFGSVIDEVGAIDDFEEAMRKISVMSLSPEFSEKIIEEFNRSGKSEEFYELIKNMAIIKATKYKEIGVKSGISYMLGKLHSPCEARENIARIVNNIKGYGNSSGFRF